MELRLRRFLVMPILALFAALICGLGLFCLAGTNAVKVLAEDSAIPEQYQYTITSDGSSFTVVNAAQPTPDFDVSDASIQIIMGAIQANADGNDCAITFGDGTNPLYVDSINFSSSSGWGTVTLFGDIVGTYSSIIMIGDSGMVVNTWANITGVSNEGGIINNNGTFNIYGGTINNTGDSYVIANYTGTINMSGGTIIGNPNSSLSIGIYGGTVSISGGAIEDCPIAIQGSGDMTLSGSPNITGIITVPVNCLSVSSGFAPSVGTVYTIAPMGSYAMDDIAVVGGAGFLKNFGLAQAIPDSLPNLPSMPATYGLAISGDDLVLAPAASLYDYTVTGNATDGFTAAGLVNNGTTYPVGNPDGDTIQSIIDAICADTQAGNATGEDCIITFGDGVNPLDLGTDFISFNNDDNTWGTITLAGSVTSAIIYYSYNVLVPSASTITVDGTNVISTGDIANTAATVIHYSTCSILLINGSSFTITGGTVSGGSGGSGRSYAIYNDSTGTINVSGGTISVGSVSNGSCAIYNNSTGEVNVNGGAVSASSVDAWGIAIYNISTGTVNINSGTVSGNYGIFNYSTGAVNVSGGTISANRAIRGDSEGEVNISDGSIIGSIAISTGALNITGGTISVTGGGSAISISGGTTNISGGTISAENNSAIWYRPGVGVQNSSLTISQGNGEPTLITSVWNDFYDAATLYVLNNSVGGGSVTITGGTIQNTAGGAAIYSYWDMPITITGGTIISSTYAINSYTQADTSALITLSGSPDITGTIYAREGCLSVSGPFTPVRLCVLEIAAFNYDNSIWDAMPPSDGAVAVVGGANYLAAFAYVSTDYVLRQGTGANANDLVLRTVFAVAFNLNGGSGDPAPADMNIASGETIPAAPIAGTWTRPGYVTDGNWYTMAGTGAAGDPYVYTPFNFGASGTQVTSGMTLYLKWIANITIPTLITDEFTYNGSLIDAITGNINDFDSSLMTITSGGTATDVDEYQIVISLNDPDNTEWSDSTTADIVLVWTIAKAQVATPTVSGIYVYSGEEQTLALTGFNSGFMSISGDTSGTDAGNYQVTVQLTNSNYQWADGNFGGTVNWSISKKILTIRADDITLVQGAPIPVLTATYSGLVNGEDESVINGELEITCDADNNSAAGTHWYITVGGNLTADNYEIIFVNGEDINGVPVGGVLTITAPAVQDDNIWLTVCILALIIEFCVLCVLIVMAARFNRENK